MGRNSGGVVSTKEVSIEKRREMMKELVGLNKALSVAQAAVTRANRAVSSARGGVIVAQNSTAQAEAVARVKKAELKYQAAVEKRTSIESQRNALKKKYDKLS